MIHHKARLIFFLVMTYLTLVFGAKAVVTTKTETYKDIIDKSLALVSQGERAQALLLLKSIVKKESEKSSSGKEIATALDEVANLFLTEKGQQNFETAQSLFWTDLNLAIGKLQETASLEPDHLLVQLMLGRAHIANGDCRKAKSFAAKTKEINEYDERVDLLNAQVLLCGGQFEEYQPAKQKIDSKKSKYPAMWKILDVEYEFKSNRLDRARDILNPLLLDKKIDPEAYYWLYKTSAEDKAEKSKYAQKYVSSCKSMTARQKRELIEDPWLCRHLPEVEAEIKKS